jgi:hypothetical protein
MRASDASALLAEVEWEVAKSDTSITTTVLAAGSTLATKACFRAILATEAKLVSSWAEKAEEVQANGWWSVSRAFAAVEFSGLAS